MAPSPSGHGYWLTTTDKALPTPLSVPTVLNECNVPTAGAAVMPTTIVLACADANASLVDLTWSAWTQGSATATGQYTRNTCVPDCAEGTFVTVASGGPTRLSDRIGSWSAVRITRLPLRRSFCAWGFLWTNDGDSDQPGLTARVQRGVVGHQGWRIGSVVPRRGWVAGGDDRHIDVDIGNVAFLQRVLSSTLRAATME